MLNILLFAFILTHEYSVDPPAFKTNLPVNRLVLNLFQNELTKTIERYKRASSLLVNFCVTNK